MGEAAVPTSPAADRPRAPAVYGEAVALAREVYRAAEVDRVGTALPWPENTVRKMVTLIRAGDTDLLSLADRSVMEHFLFGHIPNVTILSLRVGQGIGLGEEDLVTLGLAAFLHDVGLADHMELAAKATKLTDDEYKTLRTHVESGQKVLDLFAIPESDFKATIRRVIGQSHERPAGQGYPGRLTEENIHPFAKIISLVDVYESLSHARPWRPRMLPHDVLRQLIEEPASEFDPGLLRLLVEALSLYPPGSYVRLNTREIGRVASVNAGLPLRPRLSLFVDGDGRRLDAPQPVNLAVTPDRFITEAVDETKIKTADARLALELRAQRWWVKGL